MGESLINFMETTIKFTAHLTESHQLKAADKLIATLRQQNAANEEYINELEEENQSLKEQIEQFKLTVKKVQDKYSIDKGELLRTDEIYLKYKKEIDELREENARFKRQKEDLICRIVKLENV